MATSIEATRAAIHCTGPDVCPEWVTEGNQPRRSVMEVPRQELPHSPCPLWRRRPALRRANKAVRPVPVWQRLFVQPAA